MNNERSVGWLDLEIDQLNAEYHALITVMSTPFWRALKDERYWGKIGCYTVKEGYRAVDVDYNSYNNDMKWKKIWNKGGLPKISVFF